MESQYDYVIVGGGLAGASAVLGIREHDIKGTVLLLGEEKHLPYDRPPLSKKLWFGKAKVEEIFLHEVDFYVQQSVTVALGAKAVKLDPDAKTVTAANGEGYRFGKLLLATGGTPRRLSISGGGFIGSELAAALNTSLDVTMVFPGAYLCNRVFPDYLGQALQQHYQKRGVRVCLLKCR